MTIQSITNINDGGTYKLHKVTIVAKILFRDNEILVILTIRYN